MSQSTELHLIREWKSQTDLVEGRSSRAWWFTTTIPVPGRLRWDGCHTFEANLGYMVNPGQYKSQSVPTVEQSFFVYTEYALLLLVSKELTGQQLGRKGLVGLVDKRRA